MTLLIADVYRFNCHGQPAWGPLVADPMYVGAILKATQGIDYATAWFVREWPAVRIAAGGRYGDTFVRGAYHYLTFHDDGVQQAEYYLATVAAAGGWDRGDLFPIVDVERGGDKSGNHYATKAQIEDCTSAFVAKVKAATGQRVIIYGRGAMRDLGITTRFGGDYLWNPGYTAVMPSATAEGWPDDLVVMWQYTDGTVNHTTLPTVTPGLGRVDASLYRGPDVAALRTLIQTVATPPAAPAT